MKREFLLELMADMPKNVVDAIMEENGRDIQAARQSAQDWEEQFNRAVQEHEQAMAQVRFENRLDRAIGDAGGRSRKAIAALLDVEALRQQSEEALKLALEEVKKECGYLFRTEQPPLYAPGTGTAAVTPAEPESLAGALREKFERK